VATSTRGPPAFHRGEGAGHQEKGPDARWAFRCSHRVILSMARGAWTPAGSRGAAGVCNGRGPGRPLSRTARRAATPGGDVSGSHGRNLRADTDGRAITTRPADTKPCRATLGRVLPRRDSRGRFARAGHALYVHRRFARTSRKTFQGRSRNLRAQFSGFRVTGLTSARGGWPSTAPGGTRVLRAGRGGGGGLEVYWDRAAYLPNSGAESGSRTRPAIPPRAPLERIDVPVDRCLRPARPRLLVTLAPSSTEKPVASPGVATGYSGRDGEKKLTRAILPPLGAPDSASRWSPIQKNNNGTAFQGQARARAFQTQVDLAQGRSSTGARGRRPRPKL